MMENSYINCVEKGPESSETSKNLLLRTTSESHLGLFQNWLKKDEVKKPFNESRSSSTTHLSENTCLSENFSLSENPNVHDDEDWTNSLETCLTRSLDGNFTDVQDYHIETPCKETFEQQLNNYFAKSFYGIGNDFEKDVGLDKDVENKLKLFSDADFPKPFENHTLPYESFSISSDGATIFGTQNHIVSNVNGISRFQEPSNLNLQPDQLSDQGKDSLSIPSNNGLGPHSNIDGILYPGVKFDNVGLKGYSPANLSNCSNISFNGELGNQLSGSLLNEIFQNNEPPKTLSEISNDSFDSMGNFKRDILTSIQDTYYKSLNNSKEIDFIVNMDSSSRSDGVNRDLGDVASEALSSDVFHDSFFSDLCREAESDDSEGWDTLMKKLCISSINRYYPSLVKDQNKSSFPFDKDSNESGITLKNRENLPAIMPADPNLGFKKTSLCKYWQRGICANDDCNFAHGKKELRSTIGVWRTTICHHWKTGVCRVGKDCRHAHGEEELQPKNIPANVLKNKLLNSARKYEYMRKKKSTY